MGNTELFSVFLNNPSRRRKIISPVLKAISRYRMIEKKEKVAVAISGGRDSTLLLIILDFIRKYSHLSFEIVATHVKNARGNNTLPLREFVETLEIPYLETALNLKQSGETGKYSEGTGGVCSLCSRLRRGALKKICEENSIHTLALGHHADDIAETLLMNIVESKKLGSMCPVVKSDDSAVRFIRPMIYLAGETIEYFHRLLELPVFSFSCPGGIKNRRLGYRKAMRELEKILGRKRLGLSFVDAMENIDFSNMWLMENLQITSGCFSQTGKFEEIEGSKT